VGQRLVSLHHPIEQAFPHVEQASRMMNALGLRLRTLGSRRNPRWTKVRNSAHRRALLQVEGLEGRALLASITEFPIPSNSGSPNQIVAGPDGNLGFTENDPVSNAIGRITTDGQIAEFEIPTFGGSPFGITVGPDGNLWFAENFTDKIGRITTDGQITKFPIGANRQFTEGITTGPDGSLWFAENGSHAIDKVTTSGRVTQYPLSSSMTPVNITTGPNGNLWFTDKGTHSVGEITTSGSVTEFPLPSIVADPTGIVSGPRNQDLWVTEDFYGKVAEISPRGSSSTNMRSRATIRAPTGSRPGPITTSGSPSRVLSIGWGRSVCSTS
jgi:virginiamycin B lyase